MQAILGTCLYWNRVTVKDLNFAVDTLTKLFEYRKCHYDY